MDTITGYRKGPGRPSGLQPGTENQATGKIRSNNDEVSVPVQLRPNREAGRHFSRLPVLEARLASQADPEPRFSSPYSCHSASTPTELLTDSPGPVRHVLCSLRWCSETTSKLQSAGSSLAAEAIWAAIVCHCGTGAGGIRLGAKNGILFIGCQGWKAAWRSFNSNFQSATENTNKTHQMAILKSTRGSSWGHCHRLLFCFSIFLEMGGFKTQDQKANRIHGELIVFSTL